MILSCICSGILGIYFAHSLFFVSKEKEVVKTTVGNFIHGDVIIGAYLNNELVTDLVIPKGVTSIGDLAFYGCDAIADVYYSGSESEWNEISIEECNICLTNATIHYINRYEQNTSPSGGKYKIILNAGSGKFGDGTNQKIYYFNEGDDLIGFTSFVETPSKSG